MFDSFLSCVVRAVRPQPFDRYIAAAEDWLGECGALPSVRETFVVTHETISWVERETAELEGSHWLYNIPDVQFSSRRAFGRIGNTKDFDFFACISSFSSVTAAMAAAMESSLGDTAYSWAGSNPHFNLTEFYTVFREERGEGDVVLRFLEAEDHGNGAVVNMRIPPGSRAPALVDGWSLSALGLSMRGINLRVREDFTASLNVTPEGPHVAAIFACLADLFTISKRYVDPISFSPAVRQSLAI